MNIKVKVKINVKVQVDVQVKLKLNKTRGLQLCPGFHSKIAKEYQT